MRFLKRKIILANKHDLTDNNQTSQAKIPSLCKKSIAKTCYVSSQLPSLNQKRSAFSHIEDFKNHANFFFWKAIYRFSLSNISDNYLARIVGNNNFNIVRFREYVRLKRQVCLEGMVLGQGLPFQNNQIYDGIIRSLGRIFILNHSKDWILGLRNPKKFEYLSYRFKFLETLHHL
jgi:hypothetical protein